MKLRQSGMPEETYWETLFDTGVIMRRLHIGKELRDVVELGCGYGTFSLPVAASISGILRSYDIETSMVERTRMRAEERAIGNLSFELRDVFQNGFGVASRTQDGCLLFNILHCEDPVRVLKEAARVIADHGSVHVIHWRFDPETPRGPSLDIRPRPEDCVRWAAKAGLYLDDSGLIDLPPYHYGLVLKKHTDATSLETPAAEPQKCT
jgi:SAM-dependent methyltransferase